MFCNEERPKVRAAHPEYTVGDVAKELGKRWEAVTDKSKFEKLAAADRARYERVSSVGFQTAFKFLLQKVEATVGTVIAADAYERASHSRMYKRNSL